MMTAGDAPKPLAADRLPGWARWLRMLWPDPTQRFAVIASYQQLRESPQLLQDIALRGCVFRPFDKSLSLEVQEGRRQLALEILQLADADMGQLQRLCFAPLKGEQS